MKPSRSEFLSLRGMRYHIRHWGNLDAPRLFMLHGWMDSSITFQFMVDAFRRDWHVIAPDWRGFGHSSYAKDGYWFPDYLADLEAILAHYSPDEPVRLVGHSMGGNVACLYAGVRPDRVKQLVSLEGYGTIRMEPDQATARYRRWLDTLYKFEHPREFATFEDIVKRLEQSNPRLTEVRAAFIATHWSEETPDGKWQLLADPLHRRVNPIMMHVDDMLASWRQITARTLMLEAEFSLLGTTIGDHEKGHEEIRRRTAFIPNVQIAMIEDAAHMLQHDQPESVAKRVEDFLL